MINDMNSTTFAIFLLKLKIATKKTFLAGCKTTNTKRSIYYYIYITIYRKVTLFIQKKRKTRGVHKDLLLHLYTISQLIIASMWRMRVCVNEGIVNELLVETRPFLRIERQQTTIIFKYTFSEICSWFFFLSKIRKTKKSKQYWNSWL